MMRIERGEGWVSFHLGRQEAALFRHLLALYPRVPSGHHQIGGSVPDAEIQRLLDESLAEQRAANKRELKALLADPSRFREDNKGFRLTLSDADREWLLQVLNDIRVGSWVRAGSPDRLEGDWITGKTVREAWAMEMSGYFQMHLLRPDDPAEE